MGTTHVFLSYARPDLAFAQELHDQLEAQQFEVLWDQEQPLGCDWSEQLLAWIKGADILLVVVTRHSATSTSVKNEVLLAQDYGVSVLPIILENAEGGLWMLIRSLQWVDLRQSLHPVADVVYTLRDRPDRPRPPHPPGQPTGPVAPRQTFTQLPPPAPSESRAQITITMSGNFQAFDERDQESLRQLLARQTNLPIQAITIVRIEAGSVRVTLELPETTARWLFALYVRREPLMALLEIRAVRDLRVLQPRQARTQQSRPAEPQQLQQPRRSAPEPFTRTRRRPGIAWSRIAAPVLSLAAAVLLGWGIVQQREIARLSELVAVAAEGREIIKDSRGNDDAREYRLASPGPAPDAEGRLWLSPSERAVAFYAKNLPPPPAGQTYQLWLEQDGQVVSAGTFAIDDEGRAWYVARPGQMPAQPERAFITLEPMGGSPQPTGPIYLDGNAQ